MRARAVAIAVVVVLGTAGCGNEDPKGFARSADGSCRQLDAAVTELRHGLRRGRGPSEPAALSRVVARYAARVSAAASTLDAARAPRDERRFRVAAVRGLRRHARAMRLAAADARAGRVPEALERAPRDGGLPPVPRRVLAEAPACRSPGR